MFPWHQPALSLLNGQLHSGKLAHALMFVGPQGLAKYELALSYGQSVLCQTRLDSGAFCGNCRSCQLYRAKTHPDAFFYGLLEGKKQLSIDQIRELSDRLQLTSQFGEHKVAIIDRAETMTIAACNALLKTLEEPSAGSVIILVVSRADRLPTTIRSRCQLIPFSVPDSTQTSTWLNSVGNCSQETINLAMEASGGMPLIAQSLIQSESLLDFNRVCEQLMAIAAQKQDPVAIAMDWADADIVLYINWIYHWLLDLAKLRLLPRNSVSQSTNRIQLTKLQNFESTQIFAMLDKLNQVRRLTETNVNRQSLAEELLIYWAQLTRL